MDGVDGFLKRTADSHVSMKYINTALDVVNLFRESLIQGEDVADDEVTGMKKMIPKTTDAILGKNH